MHRRNLAAGGYVVTGLATASAAVGLVWTLVSPGAAFLVAAVWMALSVVTTAVIRPRFS